MLSFEALFAPVATLEYTPYDGLTFIPFIFMDSPLTDSLKKFNETIKKRSSYT